MKEKQLTKDKMVTLGQQLWTACYLCKPLFEIKTLIKQGANMDSSTLEWFEKKCEPEVIKYLKLVVKMRKLEV